MKFIYRYVIVEPNDFHYPEDGVLEADNKNDAYKKAHKLAKSSLKYAPKGSDYFDVYVTEY